MTNKYVILSDVAEVFNGKTPSKKEQRGNGYPVLKIKDVNRNGYFLGNFNSFVDIDFYNKNKEKRIKIGDTLILNAAHSSEYVGSKQYFADNSVVDSIATGEWLIVRPISEKIDRSFVHYWLRSAETFFKIKKLVKGIHLYPKDVQRLKIPLLSLTEQKRIAAILDKANAIRRKREKAIQLADEFLRSVFLDMFGDAATNPKKWPEGTIRELVSEAKYGTSKKANGYEGKYPILRMNNITYKGFLDLSDLKYIDMDEKEESKYLVKNGDLLFNRTNSKELVGKTAVYNKDEAMAVAGYLIRVRSNEKSNPNYISAYLNSKHGKATLFGMCKSIIGMANINAQELQDIKILIPPIKLQNKYAEIVGDVYEKKKKLSKALDESKILIKSLTQSAFR